MLLELFQLLIVYLNCHLKTELFQSQNRWIELDKMNSGFISSFCLLLINKKEFRNLVIYRLRSNGFFGSFLLKLLFPPMDTLYITCTDIGKGLYIQHGFATIISAKSIGENCYINQQVTIGYKGDKNPTIGNNVHICAGAIVIGDCHVGDNSIVGAGAVVVKDVPPNEVWGVTGTLPEKR